MKRRSRWLLWTCAAFIGLCAAIAPFIAVFLPVLVKREAVRALEEAGLSDVTLQISRLNHHQARLKHLRAGGDDRFHVESIEVDYTVPTLLKGRVHTIRVSGVTVRVGVRDGAMDLGPLAGLTSGKGSWTDMPFERVELDSSVLVIDLDGNTLEIHAHAVALNEQGTGLRIEGGATGAIPGGGSLSAEGSVTLKDEGISGELKASIPQFTIQETKVLAEYVPAAAGYEIRGGVSFDAAIKLLKGGIDPLVRLELSGVSFEDLDSKIRIEGVNSSIVVESLQPLATEPGLRLRIKKLQFGELETENFEAIFRLADNDCLDVKILKADWAGGEILGRDIRLQLLQLSKRRLDIDIQCEGLSLQEVIDFAYPDRVECEGSLYGHLPVSIHMDKKGMLSFGEGYLEARPPRGRVKLMESDAKVLLGIKRVVPLEQADKGEVPKLMALQALQDLEYTALSFLFQEEEDTGWTAHIKVGGRGPRGGNAIPINIQINIPNLDKVINLLVKGVRLTDFAKTAEEKEEEDAMNDAMETFF